MLMPITLPSESTNAPPLLPWSIAASVWMRCVNNLPSPSATVLSNPPMMPRLTLGPPPNPNEWPMETTSSPTLN